MPRVMTHAVTTGFASAFKPTTGSLLTSTLLFSGLLAGLGQAAGLPTELPGTPPPGRNVEGIMDNSFLVEEAYNQEPGVVQHIFNANYGLNRLQGSDDRSLNFAFTQEWPVFSQTHQFSYTLPYSWVRTGGQSGQGLGDILLNYRYQAYYNEATLRAFAPRFSLILPTANDGFGGETVGYQWNLPFSTALGSDWFAHANAGLTFSPEAAPQPRHDLLHYNLGASLIYAARSDLHFMLEWIGNWNDTPGAAAGQRYEFSSVILPGVRKAFNFNGETQVVLGLGAPVGLTRTAPDVGLFLYLSIEHGF
mgnify:FL=1